MMRYRTVTWLVDRAKRRSSRHLMNPDGSGRTLCFNVPGDGAVYGSQPEGAPVETCFSCANTARARERKRREAEASGRSLVRKD